MKFVIKEPTDKDLQIFKKEFLSKKAKENADSDQKRGMNALLKIIGELQSERDELKHDIQKALNKAKEWEDRFIRGNQPKNRHTERSKRNISIDNLVGDLMFAELKLGIFYE